MMTMDLMYGCSSEYDPTLEELLEVDLRSEMDRIIATAKRHPFEFMTELEYSSCHEEGMDEIDIRFDASKFDPFSLSSFGLSPVSKKGNNNTPNGAKNTSRSITINNYATIHNNKNGSSQAQAVPVLKRTSGNAVSSRNVPSIIQNNNQSNHHKSAPVVASVGSLGMSGIATLEETLGTLVS